MVGFGNYYIRQIKYPSRLNRWLYILYYSCIKTLATKHKTTTKDIINTYGSLDLSNPRLKKNKPRAADQRIIAKYIYNQEPKFAILLNYNQIMCQLTKIKEKYIEEKKNDLPHELVREIDMLTLHKVNFRTAFKETSFCAICGKQEKSLHNHHIRPLKIRKGDPIHKGYKGFDKVIAALGRKQIPVCGQCHANIHSGKYNGIGLDELYDVRLVASEGLLKLPTPTPNPKSTKINLPNPSRPLSKVSHTEEDVIVDEEKKNLLQQRVKNLLPYTKK